MRIAHTNMFHFFPVHLLMGTFLLTFLTVVTNHHVLRLWVNHHLQILEMLMVWNLFLFLIYFVYSCCLHLWAWDTFFAVTTILLPLRMFFRESTTQKKKLWAWEKHGFYKNDIKLKRRPLTT